MPLLGGRVGEPCMAVLPAGCGQRVLPAMAPAAATALTLCAIWSFKNHYLFFLVKYNVDSGSGKDVRLGNLTVGTLLGLSTLQL